MFPAHQNLNHVITRIADEAHGNCQWCGKMIEKTFCVPAQLILNTGSGGIDTSKGFWLSYEVICKSCAQSLKTAMDQVREDASATK